MVFWFTRPFGFEIKIRRHPPAAAAGHTPSRIAQLKHRKDEILIPDVIARRLFNPVLKIVAAVYPVKGFRQLKVFLNPLFANIHASPSWRRVAAEVGIAGWFSSITIGCQNIARSPNLKVIHSFTENSL
jgi:hypothetical protein